MTQFIQQVVNEGGDAQAIFDSIPEAELRAIYNAAHSALSRRLGGGRRTDLQWSEPSS